MYGTIANALLSKVSAFGSRWQRLVTVEVLFSGKLSGANYRIQGVMFRLVDEMLLGSDNYVHTQKELKHAPYEVTREARTSWLCDTK